MSYHGYDDVLFIYLELEPEIIQNFTSFTYINIFFVFNFKLSFYLPLIVLEKTMWKHVLSCFDESYDTAHKGVKKF